MRQFSTAVVKFSETLPREQVIPFVKKLTFELLSRVVLKTPVDTGRARGNFQVTIGSPAETTLEALDRGGGATISAGLTGLAALTALVPVWITNNLPYIERLENGWSKQAPQGMLAVSMAEIRVIFGD
jgi:hypothetical protein